MTVGLVDVDGHNFPNLVLMKLSAWHKHQGDSVHMLRPDDVLLGGDLIAAAAYTCSQTIGARTRRICIASTGCASMDMIHTS